MSELYPSDSDWDDSSDDGRPIGIVTGGSGLIGSALKETEPDSGMRLHWIYLSSKDVDLRDETATMELFELLQPKYVIHLAARVGGLYRNARNDGGERVRMFEDNLLINMNVIRACAAIGVSKCVLCLSTCVFPNQVPAYPLHETMLHQGPPHPSNEGYAYAKRMAEVQARLYNDGDGPTQFVCIIPTNVYGKHDNFNLEDGHVIPALMHRAFIAARSKEAMEIRGSGKPLRQVIYSEDLARLIWHTLRNVDAKDVPHGLILTNPQEHSIEHIAMEIARAAGVTETFFNTEYADGQFRKPAETLYPDMLPSGFQFTSLTDGILDTFQWFKQNYAKARL